MCVQCAMGAMTAGVAVTGGRTWLQTRTWVSPRALRRATAVLVTGGLLASAFLLG